MSDFTQKSYTKIKDLSDIAKDGQEHIVRVRGWIHYCREQGKKMIFIGLRDGTGIQPAHVKRDGLIYTVQCLVVGKIAEENKEKLRVESTVDLEGKLHPDARAPEGYEIQVTHLVVVGKAEGIDELNDESGQFARLEYRHLDLRSDRLFGVMKLRAMFEQFVRDYFAKKDVTAVTPPTITQQTVEGGSTLFHLKYYDQDACLTQSSQLYLETCLPSFGDVYCWLPSFRSEKSMTRRHLSEFTHVEAELGFITFEQLLQFIEDMLIFVCEKIINDANAKRIVDYFYQKAEDEKKEQMRENGASEEDISKFEYKFKPITGKIRRMRYSEAIVWLKDHLIYKDEEKKEFYQYGDDIPEAPERKMVDMIGEPVFLTHFPRHMKSFYMERDPENREETQSVDVLLPNVGEVFGASMRIWDYDQLVQAFIDNGIPMDNYKWYIDQRKFGTQPHGGFGMGLERLVMWLTMQHSVKECCLYPRYIGRVQP